MAAKRPVATTPPQPLQGVESAIDKALDFALEHPDQVPGVTEREGNPITLGPRVPSAADMAAKQQANATAAGEVWLKNVLAPRRDPLVAARAANPKYKAEMQKALNEDRFLHGLEQVDEAVMQDVIRQGGAAAFVNGVTAKAVKYGKQAEKLQPMLVALANEIDKMPQVTEAEREARVIAAVRGMRAIGKKLGGIR